MATPSDSTAPVQARCHCGAVTIQTPGRPREINECQCTICRRYAAAWAYYDPKEIRISVTSGSPTKKYVWGDRDLEFHFCSVCGCVTHWKSIQESSKMGVNTRNMDPDEVKTPESISFDRQYNAKTNNIHEHISSDWKVATLPDYTGTYSHTLLRPVASYIARPRLQKQIEERLRDACIAGATHSGMLILVGPGGAGKSQLALSYIQMHREDYADIIWVDARLRELVERDCIQIHRLLSGSEQGAGSFQRDVDRVVMAVKIWFHNPKRRWLCVLDDADSLHDEGDPYFVDLQRYLLDAPGVDIVVTTPKDY